MQKSTPIVSLDELLNTHAISEEEVNRPGFVGDSIT
jgi:hypothetical protein